MNKNKIYALMKFAREEMNYKRDEISFNDCSVCSYTSIIECPAGEYQVFTDSEADEATKENIIETLWAFNASWLSNYLGIPEEAIEAIKNQMNEDASPVFLKMIDDIDGFIQDTISADGRGHFLASYDHVEHEIQYNNQTFYIYRTN